MSFPRYERYKDSGVEWLGEVPEHWTISALKQKVKMRYGDALASEIREEGDVEVFGSNGQVGSHCIANTKVPAIVVGRKGSYGKIVWAEKGGFVIDTAYAIDSDTTGLDLRWVYYWLQPLGLDSLSQDTGVPGLAREKAYEMRIVVPPLSEQQTIAAFLDRETTKIDELIAEQQRLIELLKEKRQAVISHAVTKGLIPDVPMKDSGVEWLGEVPEHWDVMPLKRDLAFLTSGSRGWADHYTEDGALFIRIGNLTRDSIRLDFSDIQRVAVPGGTEGARTKVRPGDIMFSITAYLGSVAIAPEKLEVAYVSQHVALARLRRRYLLPEWVGYVSLSIVGKTYLETQGYGGTKIQLSLDDVANLLMTIPHLNEQSTIVAFLDCEITKFDTLTSEAQKAIELLKERRTALISAAVTGKIDVRRLI